MWCGDWHQLPQETVCLLKESEDCKLYLEEAHDLLYSLGNEDDENDMSRSVRVACLDPYLFGHSFFSKETEAWARSSGIYSLKITDNDYSREVREIILVMDTLAYHISVLLILSSDSKHVMPCSRLSEEHKVLLCQFDEETAYMRAASIIQPSSIYGIFRKKLRPTTLNEEQVLGCFVVALKAALAHSSGSLGHVLHHVLEEHKKDDKLNGVTKLKASGNQKFKEGCYADALRLYSEAIRKVRYNHLLYSNRAQCSLHLRNYCAAEMDARRTVILCPNFEKGYYKLVQVFESQRLWDQAKQVLHFYSRRCSIVNLNMSHHMCDLHKRVTEGSDKIKNGKPAKNSCSAPVKEKIKNVVPDLMSESDSEEEVVPPAKEAKTRTDVIELVGDKCYEIIQKASQDLVEGLYRSAHHGYKQVLSAKTDLSEFELVVVKYAAGYACLQLGALRDLKEAVKLFVDIADTHKIVVFPLSYYGLARAHVKMNRYMEAVPYINKGLDIIKKGIYFDEAITWPGTKCKVETRDKASLKKGLEELQRVCKTPPKPDAICRGEDCPMQRNIYYTDPDFRGFQQLHCHSKCVIQYHPLCWKECKESTNLTEKGFLGTVCPTPDCKDIIIRVEIIEKDGTVGRHFVHSEYDRENVPKQKKTKKEKKLEQREMKKRRRCETFNSHPLAEKDDDHTSVVSASCESVGSGHDDIGGPVEMTKQEAPKHEAKSATQEGGEKRSETSVPADDAPYVLKREDEEDPLPDSKCKKYKEKKKRNKGILSLDILPDVGLYAEYEERIARLAYEKNAVEECGSWGAFCEKQRERCPGLDPSRPFFIPEQLRDNEAALEAVLQHRSGFQDSVTTRDIRETIYQYLQEYLLNCGPLTVDDPILHMELENFPPVARVLVDEAGGLLNFLLQSMRFCVDGDLVYAYPHRLRDPGQSPVDAISFFDYASVHDAAQHYSEETSSQEGDCHSYSFEEEEDCTLIQYHEDSDHDTTSSTLKAPVSPSVTPRLNPCTPNFSCPLGDRSTAPASPKVASVVNMMETKENEPVVVKDNKDKSKNAAIVVQNLLRTLSTQHLVDCVVTALNSFERNPSQEVLKQINRKLKFCKLRTTGGGVNCGLQVDLCDSFSKKEDLKEQYLALQKESARLKQQLDQALDAKCKLQRKFALDMAQAKEELDEVTAGLQESKESWKKSKLEMESEIKKLQQEKQKLKEAKEEGKMDKGGRGAPDSSDSSSGELVKVVAELTKERFEHQELQENFRAFQEAQDKAVERAKLAEVMFLKSAREWGKERFETATRKAEKTLQDLERIPIQPTSDFHFTAEVARGKRLAEDYIKEWSVAYRKFEQEVTNNIQKIEDGDSLDDLPVLHLPSKPEFTYVPPVLPHPTPYLTNGQGYQMPLVPHPPPLERIGMPPYVSCAPGFPPGVPIHPRFHMMPSQPTSGPALSSTSPPMAVPDPSGARPKTGAFGFPLGLKSKSLRASSTSSMNSMDDVLPNAEVSELSGKIQLTEEAPRDGGIHVPTSNSSRLKCVTTSTGGGTGNGGLSDGENAVATKVVSSAAAVKASTIVSAQRSLPEGDNKLGLPSAVTDFKGTPDIQNAIGASVEPTPHLQHVDNNLDPRGQAKGDRSERLLARLYAKFPDISQEDVVHCLKEVRNRRNGLSGLTITQIISLVTKIIEKEKKAPRSFSKLTANRNTLRSTLRPMRLPPEPSTGRSGGAALHQPRGWALTDSRETQGQRDGEDTQCSICLEELDGSHPQVTNLCGHTFHELCIQPWYQNDHTCPNCRAHSLPEKDFPTLGK